MRRLEHPQSAAAVVAIDGDPMRAHSLSLAAIVSAAACTSAGHPEPNEPPVPVAASGEEEASPEDDASEGVAASQVQVVAGLLPPLPTAVTSFGAATDERYLYVAGGYHGTPHDYSREGQRQAIERVALDGSGDWERVGELPEGAQGLEVVHHAGRLCRFGGSIAKNAADEPTSMHSSKRASCLDLEQGAWTELPELPAGRSSHGVALVGDLAYVAGGWTLAGEPGEGTWHDSVAALDLSMAGAQWRSIPAPIKRRAAGVAAAGQHLVVVGGLTPEGEMSRAVDVYDTEAEAWSRGPDFPEDAFGVAVTGLPDGSVVGSARGGRLYRWTPGATEWQPAGTLAFGRFFHQLVATPEGDVIAVGGISGMHTAGRTRHVERVEVLPQRAQLTAWSMPYVGSAKNRQAAFVQGDYLYLFGGNNSLGQHDFAAENFVAEGVRIHLPSMVSERVSDYPKERQSMVVVPQNERVLSLGGFGFEQGEAVTQTEIYAFDPEAERWSAAGALPLSRTQFGAFADDEAQLWILGGLHYDPSQPGEAAFDHRLDVLHGAPDALEPLDGAQLPGPRRAHAGALHDGSYYMIGGMRGGFQLVDDCIRFELATRQFAPVPCPGAPRLSGSLVELDDHLVLVGGSVQAGESLEVSQTVEVFDPEAGTWTTLAGELPFSTRHAHVLRYGERILIVSTHNDEGRIRIALLDPAPELGPGVALQGGSRLARE